MPRPDAARSCPAAHGTVLPVMLILLGALMLLALGATQSSLLELTMSGHEMHRLRAFAAAETALAEAQAALAAAAPDTLPAGTGDMAAPGNAGDSHGYTLRDGGEDARLAELSAGARRGRHVTIAATGRSLRGTQVQLEYGVRVVRDPAGALLGIEPEFWLRRDID